jgi:hypothetical protein
VQRLPLLLLPLLMLSHTLMPCISLDMRGNIGLFGLVHLLC